MDRRWFCRVNQIFKLFKLHHIVIKDQIPNGIYIHFCNDYTTQSHIPLQLIYLRKNFLLEQLNKTEKKPKFSSQEKTNINQIRKANKETWNEGKEKKT